MKHSLYLLIFFLPEVFFAQHAIQGEFTPKELYDIAILYEIKPQYLNYKTHAKFDDNGQFTISLDSTFAPSMYKLLYGLPQEKNNFDLIYNGKEDIELKFNADKGVQFIQSEENLILSTYTERMTKIVHDIELAYNKPNIDSLEVLQIFDRQRLQQIQFENQSEGLIAADFIQASKRYIPKNFEPLKVYTKNVKSHYFDNVDFENDILNASNFFTEHAINYLFGFHNNQFITNQILSENILDLNEIFKAYSDTKLRYTVFTALMDKLLERKFEPAARTLSSKILKPLAQELEDIEGLNAILAFERTALGAKAPNFVIKEATSKSPAVNLHDLNGAETFVLIFWSSSCSHCMNEMPVIHNLAAKTDGTSISFIAIGLEEEVYKWNDLKYTWSTMTHVLALGKWDHPLVKLYNIPATPYFLVLDSNKIISAKPQSLDELMPFIQK